MVVEVVRGALVESRHRAMIVACDARGRKLFGLGDSGFMTYLRSVAKPIQALPLVTSGAARHFEITRKELAVICGSHSGEPLHTETIAQLLRKIGLQETALQCGLHPPLDAETARRLGPSGVTPLHNACSGKHAGMLALARFLSSDLDRYLDPEHPVQQEIQRTLAQLVDLSPTAISLGGDGCGAPTFAIPLERIALAYARLVNPEAAELEAPMRAAIAEVTRAMREHPEMVGGTRHRLDTDLMRETEGRVLAKAGAEGVFALGIFPCPRFPQGLGIAIKIEDGDERRARNPVVLEVLRQLEVLDRTALEKLSAYSGKPVKDHRGMIVGAVRPCFRLEGT
ncbi:MAG: asparaginase [Blastocatellia bacterium]|nr:asparaginase [Blastocatellia bacterium]MCX7752787.1 asparaginase [Blastocatellia bacterium]MDW8256867.1 asparaginase [Acidobacteriota bacterium]